MRCSSKSSCLSPGLAGTEQSNRYRLSSNRLFHMGQLSPTPTKRMMYSYGNLPHQGQQQPQNIQHMPDSSPPKPTWAVPQTRNPYFSMPNNAIPGTREESDHLLARSNIATSQSPAIGHATFSNSFDGSGTFATTDYLQGIIDTSQSYPQTSSSSTLLNRTAPWGQKVCEEMEPFPSLDPDMTEFSHAVMGQDENTPIIDLRQYAGIGPQESDHLTNFNPHSARRLSESSFSMSSTGGVLPEASTYEEMGSSEAVSYASEYDAWNHSEPTVGHLLSPLASPRRPQHENVVRGSSRSRASPAPHNNVRSSPYTLDSGRFKRWSTGQAPTSTPVSSRALAQVSDRFAPYGPRMNPHHSMPAYPPSAYNNFALSTQNVLYSHSNHPLHQNNLGLFASQEQPYRLEVPQPLPSQGLFRLLQSNADRHGGCSSHFADLSDPPDLYSSLHEESSDPPEPDMNPSDPDLMPHEQDIRFIGDLYTPRWVRGHGNKREGWCGLCKPGRWLVLKNSAFWYDKSFTHGVSAATGAAFQGPQDTRRTEGNLDVWEGLCGSCGEWIALVSSKKKGTTWFRHAYKVSSQSLSSTFVMGDLSSVRACGCDSSGPTSPSVGGDTKLEFADSNTTQCHTHPKVKDGPKRRRETQAGRVRAISSASATSSSYPIKQEVAQDAASHRHSTPTPIPGSSSLQSFGMPNHTSTGLPTSTPTSTPCYSSSAAYPTPASATPTMHSLRTPTQGSFPDVKHEAVVGMFTTPLQNLSSFSSAPSSYSNSTTLAHQVSEPDLVGIRTTTTALNSIASMI